MNFAALLLASSEPLLTREQADLIGGIAYYVVLMILVVAVVLFCIAIIGAVMKKRGLAKIGCFGFLGSVAIVAIIITVPFWLGPLID